MFPYLSLNTPLMRSSHVRDLGVTFDSHLKFNLHIDNIVTASSRMLGFILRQSRSFCNYKSSITLYYAYVFSKLNFASIVWNPQYNTYIDRIERVQMRFLRFLGSKCGLRLNRGDPENYVIRLKHLNMIILQNRRIMSDVLFVNKLLSNQLESSSLLSRINFHAPSRRFRQLETFVLPLRHTNSSRNSPIIRMLGRCNSFKDLVDVIGHSHEYVKRCLGNHFRGIST